MPISGKQLIQLALKQSQSSAPSDYSELQHVINNRQSTHIGVVEKSVFNSVIALYEYYKNDFNEQQLIDEVTHYIAQTALEKKSDINSAFLRILSLNSPYGELEKYNSNYKISAKQAFLLAWKGASDPHAMSDRLQTPENIENRRRSLLVVIRENYREYARGNPACYGGTFNGPISALSQVHRCVNVVVDEKQYMPLAISSIKPRVREIFSQASPDDQQAILAAWDIDRDETNEETKEDSSYRTTRFISNAKKSIAQQLLEEYKNILTSDEVDKLIQLINNTIDYLPKEELTIPHQQIIEENIKKAYDYFSNLKKDQQQNILASWNDKPNEIDASNAKTNAATQFIWDVKQAIQNFLLEKYKGLLTSEKISTDFLTNIDTITRDDLLELIIPSQLILDFIKQQVRELFLQQTAAVKADILTSWEEKPTKIDETNQNINAASKFIWQVKSSIEKNLLEKHAGCFTAEEIAKKFLEKIDQLDILEIEMIDLDEIKDSPDSSGHLEEKQSPQTSLSAAQQETQAQMDAALLKNPWISSPFSNTLLIVAEHYGKDSNYTGVLKKLLTLVSSEAVAKAAIKSDSNRDNAVSWAASKQSDVDFKSLVETLAINYDVFLKAITDVNKTSDNALRIAANYQTSGGFKALVEKLAINYDSFLKAITAVNKNGDNALMYAAVFQTSGGFKILVEKLAINYDSFLKAITAVNKHGDNALILAANHQTSDGFKILVEKLAINYDFFLKAITAVNKHGDNALRLAANHQTSDGFKVLAEKLATNYDAFLKAITTVNKSGDNALMLASKYQTSGGFKILVEKLAINYDLSLKVLTEFNYYGDNALRLAARHQTGDGFIALMEKLLSTHPAKFLEAVSPQGNILETAARHQQFGNILLLFDMVKKYSPTELSTQTALIPAIKNNNHLSTDEKLTLQNMLQSAHIARSIFQPAPQANVLPTGDTTLMPKGKP